METRTLNAEVRARRGKGGARKARATGKIPAVCYSRGKESIALSLSPADLRKAVTSPWGLNQVLKLVVGTNGGREERTVLLHEFQQDPLTRAFLHADFREVAMDTPTRVEVPIEIVGKPVGVLEGGILHVVVRRIPVICLPSEIPPKIEIDVTPLTIGKGYKAEELTAPAGVKIKMDPKQTVVHVVAPEEEKVAAVEEAAIPVEGEAAAAPGVPGAPGAAPGAAAPATGAAATAAAAAKPEGGKEKK